MFKREWLFCISITYRGDVGCGVWIDSYVGKEAIENDFCDVFFVSYTHTHTYITSVQCVDVYDPCTCVFLVIVFLNREFLENL